MENAKLMVVDDDPNIISAFEYLSKVQPVEFIPLLFSGQNPAEITNALNHSDTVIVDYDLGVPTITGIDVIKELLKTGFPPERVYLCSGYSNIPSLQIFAQNCGIPVIKKPLPRSVSFRVISGGGYRETRDFNSLQQ